MLMQCADAVLSAFSDVDGYARRYAEARCMTRQHAEMIRVNIQAQYVILATIFTPALPAMLYGAFCLRHIV